jgi:hypothetical protein
MSYYKCDCRLLACLSLISDLAFNIYIYIAKIIKINIAANNNNNMRTSLTLRVLITNSIKTENIGTVFDMEL